MPKFKLVFGEERTEVRFLEIEIEAEDRAQAAEAVVKAYQDGKYDTQLEEAVADTCECRNEVAYSTEEHEYVVLLPWD
jgi:hypothetical protein